MTLKTNDIVIANSGFFPMITKGKEYTVVNVKPNGFVYIKDDRGNVNGWMPSRFTLKPAPVKVPSEDNLSPQCKTVLRHLKRTGTITQREALMDHGIQSLTKRVADLRAEGFNIPSAFKKHPTTGQRYMRYSFAA